MFIVYGQISAAGPPYAVLTNPKSKSKFKSMVTTGFSLKSDFPTSQPATPRKVSKKQDTAIYAKQNLSVYIKRL